MSHLIVWIISASIAAFAIATANDDKWPQKFPLNFHSPVDKKELCDSGYVDYGTCDNYISNGLAKSRGLNDLYEYNSGETNIEKFHDLIDVGEKRSRRPGCDCQLSSDVIDFGSITYPRYVRNVTCDGHNRCQYSRPKGLHCLPIHYEVSVLRKRKRPINPNDAPETSSFLPMSLRCCWRAENVQVVVGCVCGHKTPY